MEFNYNYNLFLDDVRNPEDFYPEGKNYWIVCRDMESFKNCIMNMGIPARIAFDNDLGEGEGKDGYDCMKWFIQEFKGKFHKVDIHTDNPPASDQMISYVNTWFKVHPDLTRDGYYVRYIPGSQRLRTMNI